MPNPTPGAASGSSARTRRPLGRRAQLPFFAAKAAAAAGITSVPAAVAGWGSFVLWAGGAVPAAAVLGAGLVGAGVVVGAAAITADLVCQGVSYATFGENGK